MGKKKGLLYAAIERLDALMATGEKRSEAKAAAQAAGESLWTFSDGKIHSFQTRTSYQSIIMRFLRWCRAGYGINQLDLLDERADELASVYLTQRVGEGYSAWTLQTERSALRLFFQNRDLAAQVHLPQRKREHITLSRGPALRDHHVQPKNWEPLINFLRACGLRREEVRDLYVRDIYYRPGDGQLIVHVRKGKGGKERQVPVLPGHEHHVLPLKEGRSDDEKVFPRLPIALDIHAIRRQFAQELYASYTGQSLPEQEGRLKAADVDRDAALYVSRCLGHNRVDIIFGHYIR